LIIVHDFVVERVRKVVVNEGVEEE